MLLIQMIESRWEAFAALAYQQYKAEGRSAVSLYMDAAAQNFGAQAQINPGYVKDAQLFSPELAGAVESYDPETEFVVAASYPDGMVIPVRVTTEAGQLTPAQAFKAGRAPQRLS